MAESIENSKSNASLNGTNDNDTIKNQNKVTPHYYYDEDAEESYWDYNEINSPDNSTIDGGEGNDSIFNDAVAVSINGGAGDDSIYNDGENVLFTYASGDGNDYIQGFNDSSTLQITSGVISNMNVNGSDILLAIGASTVTLEGAFNLEDINVINSDGNAISLNDISKIINGTDEADRIENYFDNTTINALGGNDTIINYGDNSIIIGGAGNNLIISENGNSTLIGGSDKNTLTGGEGVNIFAHSDGSEDLINNYNPEEDIIILSSGKVVESLTSGNGVILKIASGDNDLGTITVENTDKIHTIYDDDYKEKCKELFREFLNAHVKSALKTFEEDEDIKSILSDGENSAALSDIKAIDANLAKDIADALKAAYNIGNDYVNNLAESSSSANVSDNSPPVNYSVAENNSDTSNQYSDLNNMVSFVDYNATVLVELAELSSQVGEVGGAALKGLSKATGALGVALSFEQCILNDAMLYSENTSNWVAEGSPGDNSIQKLAMIREQNPTVFDNTAKSHIDLACNVGSWVTLGIMGAAGAGAMPVILAASAFVGTGYILKWAYDEYVAKPLDAEADEFQAKMRDNFAEQVGGNIPGWVYGMEDSLVGTNGNDYVPFDPSRPHRIFTADGDDTIEATSNDNNGHYINTGGGGDSINSNSTNSTIDGGDGPDNIYACPNAVNNSINGGDGPDTINFNGNNSTVSGGKGDDTITNGAESSLFQYSPGDGNDIIEGFNDSSTLQIGNGTTDTYSKIKTYSDIIVTVGDGNITLVGGNDLEELNILGDLQQTIVDDDADDTEDDSTDDTADDSTDDTEDDSTDDTEDDSTDDTADDSTDDVIDNKLKEPEFILKDDKKFVDASKRTKPIRITGNALANLIVGGRGNDTIDGVEGDNTLTGGKGKDVFVFNSGKNIITDYEKKDKIITSDELPYVGFTVDGDDVILNFDKNNSLTIQDGVGKKINMNSTVNFYTADGILDKNKKTITLTSGTENFAASSNLKTINGSAMGAIEIIGNNKANSIVAGVNGSTLNGGKGRDTLHGGEGADVFIYANKSGKDVIENYGAGDRISPGSDVTIKDVKIKKGNVIMKFKGGSLTVNDTSTVALTDNGNETIFSGGVFLAGDSVKVVGNYKGTIDLTEDFNNVDASPAKKKLTINGNDEDNLLIGGKGKDCLTGGAGNDTLWGGKKNDTLTGGAGDDVFIFQAGGGKDIITDYTSGELLQILDRRGDVGTFKKATFKNDTLTLAIQGGGKVIFSGVETSTEFNINGDIYHVAENSLAK